MKTRTQYDPVIPFLYSIGKEELLPKKFQKTIPRSTIATWRKDGRSQLYGYQYRSVFREAVNYVELLRKHQHLERVVRNLAKSWLILAEDILPTLQKTKAIKLKFLDEIQRLCEIMPRNTVLKLAKLSLPKYRRYLDALKLTCYNSPIDLCVKAHSHQISKREMIRIKKLVTAEEFACWSKSSIYYHALRTKKLKVCLSTFYKYASMFNQPVFYSKHRDRKQGAVTTGPNQKVHIDTTFWPLETGGKAAIVLLSDNYSRAILGYSVSAQKNAGNVKNAIQQGIKTIRRYHPEHQCEVELVTDGGTENHNTTIDELLRNQNAPRLYKVIAQKDVRFSNSPIEAVNRVMKKYLRYHEPKTLVQTHKLLPEIVADYNDRPHGSLKGLAPMEGYQNHAPLDFKPLIRKGRKERFETNRKNRCKTCAYRTSECKDETCESTD